MTKILNHQRIPRPPKDLFARDIDQAIEHWRNAMKEEILKNIVLTKDENNIFLLFKEIIDCRRRIAR